MIDGEEPGEHAGACDDDEDLAGEQYRGSRRLDNVAPAKLPEYEHCHASCVDAGNGGRFRGRENAAVNSAQDDNGSAKRPQTTDDGMQETFPIKRLARAEAVAPRPPDDVCSEHPRNQQARQNAGSVKPRHRFLGGRAVDDHWDTRRDDDVRSRQPP